MADFPVRTEADVQWVFETASHGKTSIPYELLRGDRPVTGSLTLKKGWKVGTPLDLAWRASKWGLSPKPGFGGPPLSAEEKQELKLAPDAFAFRVEYIVDWGDEAKTGNNARQAGITQGDVVVAAGGKRDFQSEAHFHAWFRLTQKPGTKIEIELLRDGKRMKIRLPIISD
jgi:hypothetical protein